MFTVFGANGSTSSVVARRLIEAGKNVRLVVRNPDKVAALRSRGAEVVKGDVTDAGTVEPALAGAEGAYLLVPPDNKSNDLVGRGRRIVDNYLGGLTAAKVPHAVMLSSIGAQRPSGTGPIVTVHYAEKTLPKAAATRFTFVRAAYFMENILALTKLYSRGHDNSIHCGAAGGASSASEATGPMSHGAPHGSG